MFANNENLKMMELANASLFALLVTLYVRKRISLKKQTKMSDTPQHQAITRKLIRKLEKSDDDSIAVKMIKDDWDNNEMWGFLTANAFRPLVPFGDFLRFEKLWEGDGCWSFLTYILSDEQKTRVIRHCIDLDGLRHSLNYDDLTPDNSDDDDDDNDEEDEEKKDE